MPRARLGMLAICGFWAIAGTGCVSHAYQTGNGWQAAAPPLNSPNSADAGPQICEGRPNKVIDCTGWVLGIPGKILLFDRRVNNHAVSPDTTAAVANYLAQNQLPDVCV